MELTGGSRPLAGKVAIMTGASRGIGAAAARAFSASGARVMLAARDQHGLEAVASEIEAQGGGALVLPTDVGDRAAVERLVERTLDVYGQLDAAFNNAGGGHMPAPLAELSDDDFDAALRVNARGVYLTMKHEIPAMLANGGGAIVNMSSTAGLSGAPGMAGYAAAKHAVIGLTETAALDYGERGIRVNAIAPGPILTDDLQRADDETRGRIARNLPLHRLGRPEEVAAAAVWLCSEEASFVSGATISIDGGKLAASGRL
jgi:NAD(P)-dependent dehydrogenase (short-subunit alcohol dehydrogenase family)